MMTLALVLSLTLACVLWPVVHSGSSVTRGALVVTLAGDHKLADYFEWTCRTIGASKDLLDMLVFHEANKKLLTLSCATNVKFIDVGKNGLSRLLLAKLLSGGSDSHEALRGRMSMMLNDILLHSPRYLVEIKPMLGDILQDHLAPYSHWSYTDPDIIWGNLADWVEEEDLNRFDIVTFAKTMDAGRLFIRGQLAFHKNIPRINEMWKRLDYFNINTFTERLGSAFRMLQEKRDSDEIFARNFVSAEGWYSQLVFRSNMTVKIIGRGFDDFYRHPVVLYNGRLSRCGLNGNLTGCVDEAVYSDVPVNVHTLPEMQLVPAQAIHDAQQCKMFWLPVPTRYCIAESVYEKKALLLKDSQSRMKLQRVGESVFEQGRWRINDEEVARRQVPEHAAFFHFRHWDDFISKSLSATWNRPKSQGSLREGAAAAADAADIGCMVLYLRKDGAMAFEACQLVKTREAREGNILLVQVANEGESVAKKLIQQRKEREVGPSGGAGGGERPDAERERAKAAARKRNSLKQNNLRSAGGDRDRSKSRAT